MLVRYVVLFALIVGCSKKSDDPTTVPDKTNTTGNTTNPSTNKPTGTITPVTHSASNLAELRLEMPSSTDPRIIEDFPEGNYALSEIQIYFKGLNSNLEAGVKHKLTTPGVISESDKNFISGSNLETLGNVASEDQTALFLRVPGYLIRESDDLLPIASLDAFYYTRVTKDSSSFVIDHSEWQGIAFGKFSATAVFEYDELNRTGPHSHKLIRDSDQGFVIYLLLIVNNIQKIVKISFLKSEKIDKQLVPPTTQKVESSIAKINERNPFPTPSAFARERLFPNGVINPIVTIENGKIVDSKSARNSTFCTLVFDPSFTENNEKFDAALTKLAERATFPFWPIQEGNKNSGVLFRFAPLGEELIYKIFCSRGGMYDTNTHVDDEPLSIDEINQTLKGFLELK